MESPPKNSWLPWWLIGYAVLVTAAVVGMFKARRSVLEEYSTPESIAAWQAWRKDVHQHQANLGPVERREVKAEEPPTLVWMRDYFVVATVGAVFFLSMLYWVMAWFVTGALRGNQ
jgi:hypothetical protein